MGHGKKDHANIAILIREERRTRGRHTANGMTGSNDPFSDTKRRCADEFALLYGPCQERLYRYIVALVGNHVDAHDILQDTNLVLWQKFDQFERGTNFMAWAREVARYRVLRYRQLHANDSPVFAPSVLEAVAQRLTHAEQSQEAAYGAALPECLEKLSDADRELIRLRYARGAAVNTLAQHLHRSANAISQSLGRIRRSLRKCLEEAVRRHTVERGLGE